MELKKGYKQTEVGVIPEDWEVKVIKDAAKLINGRAYKQEELLLAGKYKVLRVGNFFSNSNWYFSNLELPENQYVENGDLMYAWSASFGPRFWLEEKTIYHYHIWKVKVKNDIDNVFLFYLFEFDKQNILKKTQGGTMFHITKSDMEKRSIPLPPTKSEQTAIATALSDADALIKSLEQLIAKKRNIKQGAMQQLLQPKEGWEVKKLGEVFTFYSTANFSKAEMTSDGEIGCMHYGLIHAISNTNYSLDNGVKYYVIGNKPKYELIKDGDIIMVDASEDLVGINKSVEVFGVSDRKFIAGLHTYLMRDENSVFVNNFRGLVLNSNEVKKQLLKLAVGMKVFGVSKFQLKEVLLPVPPLNEQTRIATILSDMDSEITALQSKLEKYRMIKQGMMQNLLTGKIRLI